MKKNYILWITFWVCFGIALHDYAHQVWQLKGYHNIIEGGYIGFAGMIVSLIIMIRLLRRR